MYQYHHHHAQRIFELPVYRCTEEQYYRNQQARYERVEQPIKQSLWNLPSEFVAQEMANFRNYWFQREGIWDFNQVMGWIRLYARAESIGASLFVVDAKRVSSNIARKRFVWEGSNFLDMYVSYNQSNAEIFDNLRARILAESRRRFKGRRYVDIGVLDVLGPHLDWATLTRRAVRRG